MTDEPSLGEVVRRLKRIEARMDERVIDKDLHTRDVAELKSQIAEMRASLAEEKLARQTAIEAERDARKEADEDEEDDRKAAVQDLKTQLTSQGSNWRQAVYAGVVPSVLFLIGILLQLRAGTGK